MKGAAGQPQSPIWNQVAQQVPTSLRSLVGPWMGISSPSYYAGTPLASIMAQATGSPAPSTPVSPKGAPQQPAMPAVSPVQQPATTIAPASSGQLGAAAPQAPAATGQLGAAAPQATAPQSPAMNGTSPLARAILGMTSGAGGQRNV